MGSDADIHYTLVDDSNRVLIENVWPRAERCPTCAIENSQTSVVPAGEVMGRFPRNSILAATHSVEFAQRWGGGYATTLRSNPMCSGMRTDRPGSTPAGLAEPDPRELMRPFPAGLMRMWPRPSTISSSTSRALRRSASKVLRSILRLDQFANSCQSFIFSVHVRGVRLVGFKYFAFYVATREASSINEQPCQAAVPPLDVGPVFISAVCNSWSTIPVT